MNITVTGGNGDLGRNLTPYLLEQGHTVVSLDLGMPTAASALRHPSLRYMVADVRNFGELVGCLRGCEAVVHLAAHRSPLLHADTVVYNDNTTGSYNVLSAAATLGIQRVCLASSINAIGGAFSRQPRYDYFPLDEQHPTYAEDPYSLSKWVLEQQADAFARRNADLRVASLRFHALVADREQGIEINQRLGVVAIRHLWAYTLMSAACRACLLALTADFTGHQAFYIVAPDALASDSSLELAAQHYPSTTIQGDLSGHAGFFNCAKAEQLLGWRHQD
jgi:nucleoside-diphosphate-sugar epimerase